MINIISNQDSNSKNNIIVVTGMSGVGKDFLLSQVSLPKKISIIGWGDMLSKLLDKHKDLMMESIDSDTIIKNQFLVCEKVIKLQPVVAICHAIRLEDGIYNYNLEIEKKLNPKCYIFITAPAKIISHRIIERNKNGSRYITQTNIEHIEREQNIKLAKVMELAALLKTELVILSNIDDEYDYNISKLKLIMKRLKL